MSEPLPDLPQAPELLASGGRRVWSLVQYVWRRIENFVFLLVVLLIALYFVLQSAWVQNWLIQRISGYLSTELNTQVSIGHVDIAFFDHLALEQVFIADQHGDTLLYAGQLTAGLNGNFFDALERHLEFSEITLTNAYIFDRRYFGEYRHNFQFLIDYFGGSSGSKKAKRSFPIQVKNLRLTNINLIQDNAVSGRKLALHLPKGHIRVDQFDPNLKKADIHSVVLSGIFLKLEERPKQPMPELPKDTTANKQPATPYIVDIDHFRLDAGHFDYDFWRGSPERTLPLDIFDPNHLSVRKIDFEADSLHFNGLYFNTGQLQHFSAFEQCGFGVTHGAARNWAMSDTLTALYGATIELPNTRLGDTILLKYDAYTDFLHFNNNIKMDIRLSPGSFIGLGDLMPLNKNIANNSFFKRNKTLRPEISGQITGKVNSLKARNMAIKVDNHTVMEGDFTGDDLARGTKEMRLSFKFDRLQSNISGLRQLIPGFNPPDNLKRLGNIAYQGRYDLFFATDHVLNGDFSTSLGRGTLNMKLDMAPGRENARYSGRMDLSRFDLGAWSGDPKFGRLSLHMEVLEGSKGLTLPTVEANLRGNIDSLKYNGYTYQDIKLNGLLSQSLFEGKIGIKDPNVWFDFDGTVNVRDTIPVYSFNADLKRLDLGRLNLVKEDMVVSGRVDQVRLSGKNMADLFGILNVRDIRVVQNTEERQIVHRIDSVRFESNSLSGDLRRFSLRSDVVIANAEGRFNLNTVANNLWRMLYRQHPVLVGHLLGRDSNTVAMLTDSTPLRDAFRFGLYLNNSRDLTKLIDNQLDTLKNISITGRVDGRAGMSEIYVSVPQLHYGNIEADTLSFGWRGEPRGSVYDIELPQTFLSGKYRLAPISVSGSVKSDIVQFRLQTQSKDTSSAVRGINLNGALSYPDSTWQIKFASSDIDLFAQRWTIEDDNYLRFSKNYVEPQNLYLMSGDKRIVLDSLNAGRGLKLTLSNFDLAFLNDILPKRKLNYRGRIYDSDVEIQDIFAMKKMAFYFSTDTVFLNNKPYGRLDGNMDMAALDEPLEWRLSVIDKAFGLRTKGAWNFNTKLAKNTQNGFGLMEPRGLKSEIEGEQFPMSVLQQFIPGISNTDGRFDIKAALGGTVGNSATTRLGLNGQALIRQGTFVIDYLNTPFYIENQTVMLTNQQIWATNAAIFDVTKKNKAVIDGGLRHNFFSDWKVDCRISSQSEDFVLMNTTRKNSAYYYGFAAGEFTATFGGTFARTDINIDATTGPNTILYIPLSDEADFKEVKFITFKDKNAGPVNPDASKPNVKKRFQSSDLKGLNFAMNLSITPAAEIQMIFDEQAGDILKGKGEGDIALIINREGEFKMYGNYNILRGEYLFTLLNFVNKPFTVAEGGSIKWYGDPYKAQLDLDATYSETASVGNLISDEIAITGDENIIAEANRGTRVDINMHMTGDLFAPSIDFGLSFPSVSPQVRTFTDNKLRVLQQDPNELNRQVFGLIMFGSFLPPDSFAPQSIGQITSTLTQFISNQLSSYLTGLASEWFGKSVSSFDVNIAYNEYQAAARLNGANASISGRELQVRMTSGFADDRIRIQVGTQVGSVANLGNAATPGTNGFLGEDLIIEFQPTTDSRWRIKAYQRLEPDLSGNFRNRLGIGLSFKRDFNSFNEMMSGVGKWFKRKNG
jgi:TamB, inner membrane protein subunit of TAM complex